MVFTTVPFSRTIVSDSDDVNVICGASACTNAHFHNSSDVFETIFEPAGIAPTVILLVTVMGVELPPPLIFFIL